MIKHTITILFAVTASAVHGFTTTPSIFPASASRHSASHSSTKLYNVFDDLKLIFSEEGKKNRAEYDERIKREQEEAQKEILRRRRNPEMMEEYERNVAIRRNELAKKKNVWEFQNRVEEGYDPKTEWDRLREEGEIEVGSDLERDPTSSRLGSEGLIDVRIDERMPYIDQGYVDEDADVVGNFMKMFGGGKKKKD
mmetsp:Transcript_3177/g.4352  ORF Transcript_3177/g.4352 Transcript_3177/m.4352 type:complete len:196 (+) Transcript_3177:116-703(+)